MKNGLYILPVTNTTEEVLETLAEIVAERPVVSGPAKEIIAQIFSLLVNLTAFIVALSK